jgi:hypothetical protein
MSRAPQRHDRTRRLRAGSIRLLDVILVQRPLFWIVRDNQLGALLRHASFLLAWLTRVRHINGQASAAAAHDYAGRRRLQAVSGN